MTGKHSEVVMRVQAVAPDTTWVHCSIHREALAAKGMPDSLKYVLDTTVKVSDVSKWCFFSLNDLNLGLQGLSTTIFNVRDKIEAMIKKLELLSVCINKDNTQVFPSLYDFWVQINSILGTMSNVI